MEANAYRQLQQKLDRFSFGFPETESGVEIKILKKLFSEEDVRIFLKLSFMLEPLKKIASKIGMPEDQAAEVLDDMAKRGLLYRLQKAGKSYYAAPPFVHGLFEYQVQRMDKEFAELVYQLGEEKFKNNLMDNAGQFLRVVPVNQAVDATLSVSPYEDAAKILQSKDNIVVAPCACRKQNSLMEDACGKPLEACFLFGSMAQYYIDHDLGRKIQTDEALEILKKAQDAGLVTQPASALNPSGMCNCCGDCCGVLRAVKEHPRPADAVFSNYYASIAHEECSGCGVCVDRCQMDALSMNTDEQSVIDLGRCIGCGLCVTKCPTKAIRLKAKAEKERRVPAVDGEAQMTNIGKNRGTLGTFVWHEAREAYQDKKVLGVLDFTARLLFKTGRQVWRSRKQ